MSAVTDIKQLKPGKRHFFIVVFALAVIMFFMASGAAINIDEILHNNQAKKVVNWYATQGFDVSCLNTAESNLKYYGQSPDNISALISRVFSIENEYATRHYTGLFFSLLLLIGTGLLAVELTGNYGVGILAILLMFVSPRMMGQAYGNLKDIPFAAGYAWSLLLMIRVIKSMPTPQWKHIIYLGLAIAFTNSVRIGGLVLFGYFALFVAVFYLSEKKQFNQLSARPGLWKQLVLKLAAIVFAGYFVGLVFWPFGLVHPLKNPLEALSVMEHYKISIKQVFEGLQVWSTNLPWYYLPKWMAISIPEIVLAGFLLSPLFFFRKVKEKIGGRLFSFGLINFALIFPVVYVIAISANLYSDWRQMYFVYAPMVVLAAVGLFSFYNSLKRKSFRVGSLIITVGLLLLPVVHTARTYPSDYIYFNTLGSSAKNSWENYEYDYYRHEMKKAAGWLKEELKSSDKTVTVASNFDITSYFPNQKNICFRYVHFYDKVTVEWDYALLGVNYVHPYQLKNNTWQPAGIARTFYHKGNPTVIILKGQDKNAFDGYTVFQNKNFEMAVDLLAMAKADDPADLNIRAYLGESYLALNQFGQVKKVVEEGKKLHPFYEPFLLLDAKQEMKQGNFTGGLEILKILIKNNPRYFKALPYLIECYEKTGNTEKAGQLKKYTGV